MSHDHRCRQRCRRLCVCLAMVSGCLPALAASPYDGLDLASQPSAEQGDFARPPISSDLADEIDPDADAQSARLTELEHELAAIKRRLEQGAAVEPASFNAPYAACDCGGDCDCGCAAGGPCTCAGGDYFDGCGPCGCGDSCAGAYRGGSGWYAGYAFVFAKPHYKESFQAMHTDVQAGRMDLIGFDFSFDLTPRVWLGYVNEDGRGMQVQYWLFDHDANPYTAVADPTNFYSAQTITVVFPATVTTLAPGDVLNVSSGLEFETIDLEGVQRYCLGETQLSLTGGLRAAFVEQTGFSSVSGVLPQTLSTIRTFEGVGPTIGALGRVPSGVTGLDFYGEFRGALLYGQKTLGRTVTPAQPLPGQPPDPPPVALSSVVLDDADDVFGGGGMELGVLWAYPTPMGDWFCQGGYSGQLWTEAGAPTLTFLGFEGFSVALGVTR